MDNLIDTIGRYCNLLEDAIEEQDWEIVHNVSSRLNDLYEELERLECGY